MTRKRGIRPPLKIIVKVIASMKKLRAGNPCRESGYAAMVVISRLKQVPKSTMKSVLP